MATRKKRKTPVVAPVAVPLEQLGLGVLFLLFIFFLATSWRKWPDPLIDFGRELYLPWRISRGALLYRDLEGHYGPFSQYFNSLLFSLFEPGLMVLVAANLIIFLGILALFYSLCRRAWGPVGAFAASATYISIFGFSQLTVTSNYNYATPYAHEVTHGIVVSLALVFILCRWVGEPTRWRSFLAGLLYGLCAILKPEFMLAGALVGVAAFALRWRYYQVPQLSIVAVALGGVLVPTATCAGYFAIFVPLPEAFYMSAGAWSRIISVGVQGGTSGIQSGFSGTEHAASNLGQHLLATFLACVCLSLLAGLGWLSNKLPGKPAFVAVMIVAAAALAWLSWATINWLEIGRCLLGLIAIYTAFHMARTFSGGLAGEDVPREVTVILLSILGVALMARMSLNGRIYHYGFYQAAIAGSILPALMVGELPRWVRALGRERALVLVAVTALLLPGALKIVSTSQESLKLKTSPVGEGVDRFYTYPRGVEVTGELVDAVTTALRKEGRSNSLLVLPEGIMINYLTRIPSTVPYYFYAATSPALVKELEAKPPERVVLISRDLREYGVERYGEKQGSGREIRDWLERDYRQYAHAGGNPLDLRQRGAVFFKRNTAP